MKLRIDILDEQDRIVFTQIGRIQAEQVWEQQAIPESDFPDHKLVLDLEEVKLVDRYVDDASVASYRQTVLTAFQQVEDNLAALRPLEQEAGVQATAVQSAERSLDLSNTRYEVGVTSYLEVIIAQNAALSDEVTAVNILGRRMANAVLVVEALGGGWDRSTLPQRPECCGKLAVNGN